MPFRSEAQRRLLWAKHPDVAKKFAADSPGQKNLPYHVSSPSHSKVPRMNALATARKSDKPTPGDTPDKGTRADAFKAKMAPRFGGKKNELAAKIASRKKKTK